jgi:glycosyltransferase involved in cell wall biosynthesis
MASEISVIICAYTEKRWHELIAAIESVHHQTLPASEIIVVIDQNPDLFQRMREIDVGAIVIENRGAKGLSGARNSGWAMARGEIIAFLDDDAIAEPNWLENLAACYTDPAVVGVGGKIAPLWETRRPSWFPEEFDWVVGCTYRGMPTSNARVRNVIGANMSIRRSALLAAGGFHEALGWDRDANASQEKNQWFSRAVGDEETELCIRVSWQLPGSVWLYTPLASVRHRVPLERSRWLYFLGRCYREGLGKARLVKLHDASTGLSSEKAYTFKTLPRGVARGLADSFLRHDMTGALRAVAIMAGLAMTAAGYFMERTFGRQADRTNGHVLPGLHHHHTDVWQSADVP